MLNPISVGILGATGLVGQEYIRRLETHPWFEISFLAASSKQAGKSYKEAVGRRWQFNKAPPSNLPTLDRVDAIEKARETCQLLFSALPKAFAELELDYAKAGVGVISSSSAHRMCEQVPLLLPEINPHHLLQIGQQRELHGWTTGFIVSKPNCSIQSYLLPLTPLHKRFRLLELDVTTLQSQSGGGLSGLALDLTGSILPSIELEEEKAECEPKKIWNHPTLQIRACCNRIPIPQGHLACVSARFDRLPSIETILTLWRRYCPLAKWELPTAPSQPIIYQPGREHPSPRLDLNRGNGMSATVGQLRIKEGRVLFTALTDNLARGAAGSGILAAELLTKKGYLDHGHTQQELYQAQRELSLSRN